jgi:hypothetical protein
MTKKSALVHVKIAGYHEDLKTGTRILIESGLSRTDYDHAFNAGRAAKEGGMKCACMKCKGN